MSRAGSLIVAGCGKGVQVYGLIWRDGGIRRRGVGTGRRRRRGFSRGWGWSIGSLGIGVLDEDTWIIIYSACSWFFLDIVSFLGYILDIYSIAHATVRTYMVRSITRPLGPFRRDDFVQI